MPIEQYKIGLFTVRKICALRNRQFVHYVTNYVSLVKENGVHQPIKALLNLKFIYSSIIRN